MTKSSLSKIATVFSVAGSLLVGQLAITSSTASASEFIEPGSQRPHHARRHYAPAPRYVAPRHTYRHEPRRVYGGYGYKKRDHRGDAVAATILGLGAIIVGAAIADAHRNGRRDY